MINKLQFTEMAKRILRKPTQLQSPQIMHPAREWAIGLLLGAIIFTVSAAWSAQMYLRYRDASVGEAKSPDKEMVVYREVMVDTALAKFEERNTKHKSLFSGMSAETVEIEAQVDVPDAVGTTTEEVVEDDSNSSTSVEAEQDTVGNEDGSKPSAEAAPELEF